MSFGGSVRNDEESRDEELLRELVGEGKVKLEGCGDVGPRQHSADCNSTTKIWSQRLSEEGI
ncbi:hypothetical protein LAZ67_13000575 [Cordylochernes scorpioides]|uniref:Uncharacterized protein n=1 Tax=Cordylochernes scorpioides TaxID=51811 RepID=A0ABY6L4Y3_9ARAC|nr:hypothetical protein LAZ67_13000575 [Cordylochernes scorpioides]